MISVYQLFRFGLVWLIMFAAIAYLAKLSLNTAISYKKNIRPNLSHLISDLG